MKILYCIGKTHNSGGMERVLANKANALVRMGHQVSIVTTDQQGLPPYFAMDPRIQRFDLGINYAATNDQGLFRKVLAYPGKQRRHQKALTALLDRLRPDICVSMFDNEANLLWRIKDGSKKVAEIHFSRYKRLQYGNKGVKGWIDRFRSRQELNTARHYDRFVVLTQEDRGYWGDLDNMEVIPNANSFDPSESATLSAKRVIAVGRYDYQKGVDELISVWSKVKGKFPDWQLHIFGQGELKVALEQLIAQLGLEEVVKLCPPTKDIQQEYVQSAMLAMTSRYEGLPMALLEGQVCGLPLVAYACKCGPRDIIEDGVNGFLLEEGDREGMADRLMRLMADEQLRQAMGKSGVEKSKAFSEEEVMKKWVVLFEKLLM